MQVTSTTLSTRGEVSTAYTDGEKIALAAIICLEAA